MDRDWLKEYNRIAGVLDSVNRDITQVSAMNRNGQDSSRLTSSINRQLRSVEVTCTTLAKSLETIPVTEGERVRRRDMLAKLRARKEQGRMDLQTGGRANQTRAAVMGGGGAGTQRSRWGMQESKDTIDVGTRDLLALQERTMSQQDEGLEILAETVARQKTIGQAINRELDEQMGLLDNLDAHVGSTSGNIERETRRVIKLTNKAKAGGGFLCLIFWILAFALFWSTGFGDHAPFQKS